MKNNVSSKTMKYAGMPSAMWMLYKKSFKNHLISDLGFTNDEAKSISEQAKSKYMEIIEKLYSMRIITFFQYLSKIVV